MSVDVQLATERSAVSGTRSIVRWAQAVIDHMGGDPGTTEVCVRIVDENESEKLNSNYRDQNKPTNVLSFPADVEVPDSSLRYLGDIVICDSIVELEALKQKKCLTDHYAHMVVHGMLHLYGYDHIEPDEADVMENIEREILGQVGIADPYRES